LTLAGLALAAMTGGAAAASPSPQGAVFTLSNSPAGNRVLVWERAPNGALLAVGAVSTGGTGTGAGLGSQGALALSGNHRWLYAVNPGSDEVSVFRVYGTHLQLMEVAPSGGDMPISITAHGELVYVLNAGGDGNIQGFQRSATGILQDIDGSNLPLSQPAPGPAQIEFAPNGRHLVVTEKATNRIDYYRVHADGSASGPHWRASAGRPPSASSSRATARSSCQRQPAVPSMAARRRATTSDRTAISGCSTARWRPRRPPRAGLPSRVTAGSPT
jgi:DNA-binding beta-propeller fold protein YncE